MNRAVALTILALSAAVSTSAASPQVSSRAAPSHLIFTSTRDGDQDIYAIDADGRRLAALTGAGRNDAVVVSRKALRIAFDRPNRSGWATVYVADAAGRHLHRVANGVPLAWSPDGSRLVFRPVSPQAPEGGSDAVGVNVDGTGKRLLTHFGGGSLDEFAGWSFDGREFALTHEYTDPSTGGTPTELFVGEVGTGHLRKLASSSSTVLYEATWSPTGHAIAYERWRPGPVVGAGKNELVVTDLDSGQTSVVATAAVLGVPVWSPDGRKLLYSASDSSASASNLEATDVVTGSTVELARAALIGQYPLIGQYVWSWDGAKVAFTEKRGLSVVDADGGGAALLYAAAPGIGASVANPIWSPDGGAIAFVEQGGLRSINADGTGLRTLATRGRINLVAWVAGSVPARAARALPLPPIDLASGFVLRSRGGIDQLVASGTRAAVLSTPSRLDCWHVLVWSPKENGIAHAGPPVPCDSGPNWRLGGLAMDGLSVTWTTDWTCGNTECDRLSFAGELRDPNSLQTQTSGVTFYRDGGQPPCVICAKPNPSAAQPDVVAGRVAAYVQGRAIHLRLLPNQAVRVLRLPGRGRVVCRLTPAGLFYGYTLAHGDYPGRVVFIPLDALVRS